MGRKPCCDKVGLKRGPWTIEEDHKLMNFIISNGIQCWRSIPKMAGLLRCGKSCRLRWINYLRPDLKRGGFTEEEEDQIIQLHETLGNRWSKIASHFEGRTDNEIKNHWNTKIKKRLKGLGVQKSVEPKQTTTDSSEAPTSVISVENNNPDNGFEGFANKMVLNDDKEADSIHKNEDDHLLGDYEIFNGSLEVIERWLNEESIEDFEGQTSSGSFQESLNASMSEFSPEILESQSAGNSGVQLTDIDEYLHDLSFVFDYGMNPSFGFNNHLEDQLLFPEEHDLL